MLKQNVFMVLLLLCTVQSILLANTKPSTTIFIDTYSPIAVTEMHRSGIPASITLGQAIIESGWGKSELARGSKNFFGIKCKSTWTGDRFMYKDDDYVNGKLVDSCFRVYANIYDSFQDHTDFLVNRPYYKKCFDYASNDYVNWAVELQKSGYATAQDYALKLIDIIEKYNLSRFDTNNAVAQRTLTPTTTMVQKTETITRATTQPYIVCMPVERADIEAQYPTVTPEHLIAEMEVPTMEAAGMAETLMPTDTDTKLELDFDYDNGLAPPPTYALGDDYIPTYRNHQLGARSIAPNVEAATVTGEEKKSYYRTEEQESAVKKQHPYNRNISTYKKHVRPIRHYPKASNNKRR